MGSIPNIRKHSSTEAATPRLCVVAVTILLHHSIIANGHYLIINLKRVYFIKGLVWNTRPKPNLIGVDGGGGPVKQYQLTTC